MRAGILLNPQPCGHFQGPHLDCCESMEDEMRFDFYEGNEMEGHSHVTTIFAPENGLIPELDWQLGLWIWTQRTKPSHYAWLRSQPWFKEEAKPPTP